MAPSKLSRFVVAAAAGIAVVSGLATAALAGGQMHSQTHHCKMPDGTMDVKKTHKQCTAANGTWFKDVPTPSPSTPAPAKPSTPAPSPAPAAPAPSTPPAPLK